MPTSVTITVSAAIVGIYLMALVSILQTRGANSARYRLVFVLSLITGLAITPLIATHAPQLYPVYMPLMLPVLLTIPGAVFFYIGARLNIQTPKKVKPWHLFIPIAGMMVTIGYWILPEKARSSMFLMGELPPGSAPSILAFATFALILIWSVVSFAYLVLVLKRLNIYRASLKDLVSNTEVYSLRWVESLMFGFVILWIITAISLVGDNLGLSIFFSNELPLFVTAAVLLLLSSFPPKQQPELEALGAFTQQQIGDADPHTTAVKYSKSALSVERKERLSERIEHCMSSKRIFLDPNLTLKKLSDHIGATTNTVSQTLNEEIGMSFFDYVASCRAKAAKSLLIATDKTVLNICLEVGFNSRSTFYKAFKKEFGVTPSDLRKSTREITPQ